MNKYPYPVLTYDGSSYKENIEYELTYVRSFSLSDSITFEFNLKMNSVVLKDLIESGNAKMIIKAQSGIFATSYDVDIVEGNYKCTLLLSNIQSNDTLKFTGYIIADKEMIYEANSELLDIYDVDYKVSLNKRAVLAISNVESLSYSTSNNDFIKFGVSDEQNGNGFRVGYETNYINVTIGPGLNGAYGIVKNNRRDVCSIFDSHLVFEVFIHTLVDLVQQYDDYCETEWYKLFEQVFLQCGEYKTFEDFINSAKDNEIIDMPIIFEMAHKMINNQIENSLISLSKYE